MSAVDIVFGFLAGVVSCLTPEALLLLPLVLVAAGASSRVSMIAPAVGLGLSLVLTGIVAGSFGMFGFDAFTLRRIVCAVLLLLSVTLMSASLAEQFSLFIGGHGSGFTASDTVPRGGAFRLLLLAVVVGANWIPLPGPILGKASLMSADVLNSGAGLAILFAFGAGAAVPWIVLGRVLRLLLRPVMGGLLRGMAGKRLLGLTLLVVAILGGSGLDLIMEHWLNGMLPDWTRKLALTF